MGSLLIIIIRLCALLFGCLVHSSVSSAQLTGELRNDADLHDVHFVDIMHGWSAGDRGAIWHTADGGVTWSHQDTPTDATLEAVWFIDTTNGWAAGGMTHPFTHLSSAVVLKTSDGGKHWQRTDPPLLPWLTHIEFTTKDQGWAIGQPTSLYSSGVFHTTDGGRSWQVIAGIAGKWETGSFSLERPNVVAGTNGVGLFKGKNVRLIASEPCWDAKSQDGFACAVGPAGMMWTSVGTNSVWRQIDLAAAHSDEHVGELRPDATYFDLRAVAVKENSIWVAGAPGTQIFRSLDRGQSWNVAETGHTLPIASLSFPDDKTGYAVGAYGMILKTENGGQTWQSCRNGGARAALLAIHSRCDSIPWELLAHASGKEGYLSRVSVLTEAGSASQYEGSCSLGRRIHDALNRMGSTAASRLSGPQLSATQLESWLIGQSQDEELMPSLIESTVRSIRQWRPEIILTDSPNTQFSSTFHQLVNDAVELAQDPNSFPHHAAIGLSPWHVKQTLCPTEGGAQQTDKSAEVSNIVAAISHAQIALPLGKTLKVLAQQSRSIVDSHSDSDVSSMTLVCRMSDETPFSQRPRILNSLFSDIRIPPARLARRANSVSAVNTLRELKQITRSRRSIEALMKRADGTPAHWQKLAPLLNELPSHDAGWVLFLRAKYLQKAGQFPQSAEMLESMCGDYPNHELKAAALAWLCQYYASIECRQHHETALTQRPQQLRAQSVLDRHDPNAQLAGLTNNPREDGIRLVSFESNKSDFAQRFDAADQRLRMSFPGLAAEPILGFCRAAVDRHRRSPEAIGFYRSQLAQTGGKWSSAAAAELSLGRSTQNMGLSSDRLWCPFANSRPKLDGDLGDSNWQGCTPIRLIYTITSNSMSSDHSSTFVLFTHDDEFLFVAIRCPRDHEVPTVSVPRLRDTDLSQFDRVGLQLDTNRDYASYFHLTIDQRGWTADACFEDSSWNPQWYVASGSTDQYWTVEAAIPISELTESRTLVGQVWNVSASRSIPSTNEHERPVYSTPVARVSGYLHFSGQSGVRPE